MLMRAGVEWFVLIETVGILSFAINAMIIARAKELSVLGIFVCAVATALGGGTLRDLLLGPAAQPFFWIAYPAYMVAIFAASVLYGSIELFRTLIARRISLLKDVAEAVALSSLGALGAVKAYNILAPALGSDPLSLVQLWVLCAFFGAVSAAFGSIIRDIIINEFPASLRSGPYVLEALFIGSGVLTLFLIAGLAQPWAILWGFSTTLLIRAAVVWRGYLAKA